MDHAGEIAARMDAVRERRGISVAELFLPHDPPIPPRGEISVSLSVNTSLLSSKAMANRAEAALSSTE